MVIFFPGLLTIHPPAAPGQSSPHAPPPHDPPPPAAPPPHYIDSATCPQSKPHAAPANPTHPLHYPCTSQPCNQHPADPSLPSPAAPGMFSLCPSPPHLSCHPQIASHPQPS